MTELFKGLDFTKKTTINAANKAINAALHLKSDGDKSIPSVYLVKAFGHNPLQNKFRNALLICTDPYYEYVKKPVWANKDNYEAPKGTCRKWKVDEQALEELISLTHVPNTPKKTVAELAIEMWKSKCAYINRHGVVDFRIKTYRRYHDASNVPSIYRPFVFPTFIYDYDASCSIVSTAYEDVKQLDKDWKEEDYHYVKFYINNKKLTREYISAQCGVELSTAKEIIAALNTPRSVISTHPKSTLGKIGLSNEAIHFLQTNDWAQGYVKQIHRLWKMWGRFHNMTAVFGNTTRKIINKEDWFHLYLYAESKVLQIMIDVAKINGAKVIDAHDGIRTDTLVNSALIGQEIYNKLGWTIKIDFSHDQ